MNAFNRYLQDNRGAAARIAEALGLTHAAVRQWKEKGVPAERVLDVERITGISRHDMRADVFGPYPTIAPASHEPQQAAWQPKRGQLG